MPFALVAIGLLMIITGIQNTYVQFSAQLQSDFTGSKSFIVWIIALGAVGALGYIKDLREFSHYFMALILISMVLSNGKNGLFQNFTNAIASGPKAPTTSSTTMFQQASPIPTVQTPGAAATVAPSTPTSPPRQMTFGESLTKFFNSVLTSPAN